MSTMLACHLMNAPELADARGHPMLCPCCFHSQHLSLAVEPDRFAGANMFKLHGKLDGTALGKGLIGREVDAETADVSCESHAIFQHDRHLEQKPFFATLS